MSEVAKQLGSSSCHWTVNLVVGILWVIAAAYVWRQPLSKENMASFAFLMWAAVRNFEGLLTKVGQDK